MSGPIKSEHILERPRINALLEKALDSLAVFVIAGEGYGKTCAVHSFLRKKNINAIRISISEADNDPVHFWGSIVKAVAAHSAKAAKVLEEIGFPETPGQITRCLSVLAEGAATERVRNVFVADDCHLIHEETILNAVNQILVSPFPRETVMIISRSEPKLNTMSLLSKGLMYRINADDLRFNDEETAAFLGLHGIGLSPEEAECINTDTEGWILGIGLLAEEMKKGSLKYSSSLLEQGAFRNMEENFFLSVSAPLRRFLIILSLFDQWPLEAVEKMAAALGEKLPPIEELTLTLNRSGSLMRYDAYLHGIKILKPFLDFLREKQRELSGEEIKTAGAIAAEWCMENGFWIEAAYNYGMAEDFGQLLKAIYSYPRLISRQTAVSLLKIIDGVSRGREQYEEDGHFLFLRHVIRAGLLLNLGQYTESKAVLLESIRKFEELPQSQTNSWILSACCNAMGAISIITRHPSRDLGDTLYYFKRSYNYFKQYPYEVSSSRTRPAISSYVNFIGHPPKPGEYEEYIDILTQSIPYASASQGGFLEGMDSLCRAEYELFRGDISNAEQHAREAVLRAREKKQYETESKSLFYLLRINLMSGNISAFMETWEQMEAQLAIPDYINRYTIHDIMTGWFYAHAGETEQVTPWLKKQSEESGLNMLFHSFEQMVRGKILFAEKKFNETLAFLGRRELREGLGTFHLGMLEISVLQAAVYCRLGDSETALKELEASYKISLYNPGKDFLEGAEPGVQERKGNDTISFDMPFIELGEEMRILSDIALNGGKAPLPDGIPRSWLENIRNKASFYEKNLAAARERYRNRYGISEIPFLTSQELAILAGISRGLTREEIAGNCSLSVNTVKNMIKTIYEKLGAFNRADAIRIAKEADLLK